MTRELHQKITTSFISSYTSQFLKMAINFGSKLVLARMILPQSWGIFAEAYLIIMICGAFRDLGMPYNAVRYENNSYGNMLGIEIITSFFLITLIYFLSPWASFFNADLPGVLRVFSWFILIEGIGIIPKVYAQKELLIKQVVWIEILNLAVMALVSIVLAYLGYGVWSLVLGQIAGQLVLTIFSWLVFYKEIKLQWQFDQIADFLKGSLPLFLVWAFSVTSSYIDNGIVGAFFSEAEVGFYFMAYFVARIAPEKIIYPSIWRVSYPAMVQMRDNPSKVIKTFIYSTIALMCVEVPVGYFLFFNADAVVPIFLGQQWLPIIPVVRVIALTLVIDPFKLGSEMLKVWGYDKTILISSFIKLMSLIIFGIIFTKYFGLRGMAAANLIILGTIPTALKIIQRFEHQTSEFFGKIALVHIIAFPLMAIFYFFGRHNLILQLVCAAIAFLIIGFVYYKLFGEVFKNFVKNSRGPAVSIVETV